MAVNIIDAGTAKTLFLAGVRNLEANKAWIDELNVFPVPDGDTGTNMTMTLLSAVNEVKSIEQVSMESLAKAISRGSLRGARGNSGVITSQILRGFTRSIEVHEKLTVPEISAGFERAVETAYKAVMKPKEGTILTVARGMAEMAKKLAGKGLSIDEYLGKIIEEGEIVLAKTPDMLPVLKEAGVVDAGGQGLILFMKGIHDYMTGKAPEIIEETVVPKAPAAAAGRKISTDDIKFGYCTEFIVNLEKPVSTENLGKMKEFLDSIGDSIVLVADDEFIKIHVHTNNPGKVLQKALMFGELTRIKIDNMREEHRELLGLKGAALEGAPNVVEAEAPAKEEPAEDEPPKEYGFIAVAAGDGFSQLFGDVGVDKVITGGQTMNPCTEDFLEAIEKINAKTIFVMPDNSNIILAATQAASMTTDKKIIVIPTKTVPQGITSMLSFDPDLSAEENEANMNEMMSAVRTVSVTYSIRDTTLDGFEIHEGDIMAVGDKGILAVGKDITEVSCQGIMKLVDEDSGIISIYYGEGYSEEDANALAQAVTAAGAECDIEVMNGGQPVYYCVAAVE
ncbi:MAG: DAK2 domain-containing protein [Lachnospiraceae bacterium]|nr:DAK2 domain-containing protein [Lachnospiraceae bacterium]